MTSQDTFEHLFREQLLDLIYAQWTKLCASFSTRSAINDAEVIDPEALLWCSLEFLQAEPRLGEAVRAWVASNENYLVRQRIYKLCTENDPRTPIWEALDRRSANSKTELELPSKPTSKRLGRIESGPSTLLLRARDLLGHDIRHFLLVYLLANHHGGRLRDVQAWSGHSYRSLSDAAGRWESADIVTLNAGYCRLLTPEPFRVLLQVKSATIVTINWLTVFEIGVRLLRDLAKARQNGLGEESTVTVTLQREAIRALKSALHNSPEPLDSSVGALLRSFETLHV
jgi:hypothetical protein